MSPRSAENILVLNPGTSVSAGLLRAAREEHRAEGAHGRLGFLILEGMLARDMTVAGRTATELLGEGDVVQPWLAHRDEGLVRYRVAWNALMPVRFGVLDDDFGRSLARGRR